MGKLATLSEKYTLETYQKIPIDKLLALLCYFVHCSILRMKYLHKFNIKNYVSEQSKTSFMNYFNNAIKKGKDKLWDQLSKAEKAFLQAISSSIEQLKEWKEWTMYEQRSAIMLGFSSVDFPESDAQGKGKLWDVLTEAEKAAFNICLPSGEWKKWDNMTMDQRRSALMLGFASDDFPESDRKGKTKQWADLNAAERAAFNICFTQWRMEEMG